MFRGTAPSSVAAQSPAGCDRALLGDQIAVAVAEIKVSFQFFRRGVAGVMAVVCRCDGVRKLTGIYSGVLVVDSIAQTYVCATKTAARGFAYLRVAETYCICPGNAIGLCNMLIGYARVSTNEQDAAAQVQALKSAGCEIIFREKASGGRWDRPELHRLLGQLRKGDSSWSGNSIACHARSRMYSSSWSASRRKGGFPQL